MVCGSLLVFRRRAQMPAPGFRLPAGTVVALTGIGFCLYLLGKRTFTQAWILLAIMAVGWVLGAAARGQRRGGARGWPRPPPARPATARVPAPPLAALDRRKRADRVEEFVAPRVARLTLPYLREKPAIGVGYGFVLHSPLEGEERQISRLIEDAVDSAELRARLRERDERETVLEIIYNRKIWTGFPPIMEIESHAMAGPDGLSRGPRRSG